MTRDGLLAPTTQEVDLPDPGRFVAVAGDWHGNDRWATQVIAAMSALGCTTVLQVGDFGVWPGADGVAYLDQVQAACEEGGVRLLLLEGNHDDLDQLEGATRRPDGVAELRPQVWHLPRALRWSWRGVRFAALGGATSLDARHRRRHVSWWPQEAIRPEQHDRLIAGGPTDVLLTHDAPADARVPGLSPDWDPAAVEVALWHRKALQHTVDAVAPALLLHGHMHVRYSDDLSGGTRVEGLDCDGTSLAANVVVLDLGRLAEALVDPSPEAVARAVRNLSDDG